MQGYFFRVLLVSTFLCGSFSTLGQTVEREEEITEHREPIEKEGFGISVSVNKPVYSSGESISMTLRVFNNTDQVVTFSFRNAQRYDFTIEDDKGNDVWHWSNGRMFAQVLGQVVLGKERSEQLYNETYTGTLKAGEYKVTGNLTAFDRAISASIMIIVR